MEFGDQRDDTDFQDEPFQLPSVSDYLPKTTHQEEEKVQDTAPKGKCAHRPETYPKRANLFEEEEEEEEDVVVLDSGIINRAPLPIDQARKTEISVGAEEGSYFVELMRKRLRCIRDMQVKWGSRACNKRNPKYVKTQARLKDFAEVVLDAFDSQFGLTSDTMLAVPTRKHLKTKKGVPIPSAL
jgi:hypothetical protein